MIHAHNKKLQTTPEIIFQQNEMLIDNKKCPEEISGAIEKRRSWMTQYPGTPL